MVVVHGQLFRHLFPEWSDLCLCRRLLSACSRCVSCADVWSCEYHAQLRHAYKFHRNSTHSVQHRPKSQFSSSRERWREMLLWRRRRPNWRWDFDLPRRISFVNRSAQVWHQRRHRCQIETRRLGHLWWSFPVSLRRTSVARERDLPSYAAQSNRSHGHSRASTLDWWCIWQCNGALDCCHWNSPTPRNR